VFAFLCALSCMLVALLGTAVAVLWAACRLCRVDRPPLPVAVGIVFVSWLALTAAEAVLLTVTQGVYEWLGYPFWEARVACTFVGLPMDMVIASALHAALMREGYGKAIEVWFVQRLMLLSVVLGVIGLYALAAG
jgi:hypothetical protein